MSDEWERRPKICLYYLLCAFGVIFIHLCSHFNNNNLCVLTKQNMKMLSKHFLGKYLLILWIVIWSLKAKEFCGKVKITVREFTWKLIKQGKTFRWRLGQALFAQGLKPYDCGRKHPSRPSKLINQLLEVWCAGGQRDRRASSQAASKLSARRNSADEISPPRTAKFNLAWISCSQIIY